MARIPNLSLRAEDFPEIPWIDRLIRPLSVFGTDVRSALARGLTLAENAVSQVVQFQVTLFEDKNLVSLAEGWDYFVETTEEHYQPPIWRKTDDGMIWLNGSLAAGAARSRCFSLPPSATPARNVYGWSWGSFSGMPQPYAVLVDKYGDVYAGLGYDGACDFLHMNFSYEAADPAPIPNAAFPLTFLLQLPQGTSPVGVVPLRVVEVTSSRGERGVGRAVSVDWTTSGDQLVVTDMPGLVAGKKYRVTLLVLGE